MNTPHQDLLGQARLLHAQLQREIGTSSISLFDYLKGYYGGSLADLTVVFSGLQGKRELLKTLEYLFPDLLAPTPPACPAACLSRKADSKEPFYAFHHSDIIKADYDKPTDLPVLAVAESGETEQAEIEAPALPPSLLIHWDSEWLHAHQIAGAMGIKVSTVYNYASTGKLETKRENGITLYRQAA